jgi:PTS system nitrogen regulatory IIA component
MQLSVREVSRLLKVPENTVCQWVADGTLPALRVNSRYYFSRAELLEWATQRRIEVVPDIFRSTQEGAPEEPRVAESLQAGSIHYDVPGADRESVLREVVARMPVDDPDDRVIMLELMLAREKHASTAVGNGIAIPHPRAPVVLHVDVPLITLCFLQQPILFGPPGSEHIHTLFAIQSPSVRTHQQLLSRLAFMLRDPSFRSLIERRAPADEIVAGAGRLDAVLI